jgi:hypothetical protein
LTLDLIYRNFGIALGNLFFLMSQVLPVSLDLNQILSRISQLSLSQANVLVKAQILLPIVQLIPVGGHHLVNLFAIVVLLQLKYQFLLLGFAVLHIGRHVFLLPALILVQWFGVVLYLHLRRW